MNRLSQGLVMGFFGGVLARMAASDIYLRYVTEWMKWPILASGIVLVVLGLGLVVSALLVRSDGTPVVDEDDDHAHHGVPAVTWLLALPGMMFFLVSPPELGAYLAERRAGETVVAPTPATVVPLAGDGDEVVPVDLVEFIWRAQDGGQSLQERTVALKGFVSYDDQGRWYLTQMLIGCCAADAQAYQVRVDGAPAPARDQWVRVTGTYEVGSGGGGRVPPVIEATEVKEIEEPRQTYG